ncbi:MAG: hypothetical protein U0I48_02700, partial [Acutalibacteraceae bacterium]|nr:hypothetical protein [Acutalibacteraceae bacterium]
LERVKGKPATRFSLVDEKGLQKGKTANCFSLLIKHIKFYEKTQEAVCFIKKTGRFSKTQEAGRFKKEEGTAATIPSSLIKY